MKMKLFLDKPQSILAYSETPSIAASICLLLSCNAQIYNGKGFVCLKITEDMVGDNFGEFVSTRKTSLRKRVLPSKTTTKPIKKVR